jgi:hypothetical protein
MLMAFLFFNTNATNPQRAYADLFGRNLNIGVGIGNNGFKGHPSTVVLMNYEFSVAKNFTLAPFVGFYTYSDNYYWGNKNYPYRYYNYRETVIPVGVKLSYYFDELFKANPSWDFYGGASLGFEFRRVSWSDGYYGDNNGARETSPLLADLHIGARYHFNQKIGMYLDLSSGFSTVGLSFKL